MPRIRLNAAPALCLAALLSSCAFSLPDLEYYRVGNSKAYYGLDRRSEVIDIEIEVDARATGLQCRVEAPVEGGSLHWELSHDDETVRRSAGQAPRVLNLRSKPGTWMLRLHLRDYSGDLKAHLVATDRPVNSRDL